MPPPGRPERTRRAREKSSRSDLATGFLYMGAASRKPPRPRLTLRLQPVHWQAKNGRIGGSYGGKQEADSRVDRWSRKGSTAGIYRPMDRSFPFGTKVFEISACALLGARRH